MAISPPSDIVLDVAMAADPNRMRVAFDRLSRMGSGVAGTQFASVAEETARAPGLANARAKLPSLVKTAQSTAKTGPETPASKTLRQFEAQVISLFIEQMMPEASANTFGSGLSGGVWRSMLSEQIAGEVAKTGGLGIRSKVMAALASRSGSGAAGPDTVGATPQRALDQSAVFAGASARDLAIPLSVERHLSDIRKPGDFGAVRNRNLRQA